MHDENSRFDMEIENDDNYSLPVNVDEKEFKCLLSQQMCYKDKKNLPYFLAKSLYESGFWDSLFPQYELGILGAILENESTWLQFIHNFIPQSPFNNQTQVKAASKARKVNTRARGKKIGILSKKKSIQPGSLKNDSELTTRSCLETLQTRVMVALFDSIVDEISYSQKNEWNKLYLDEDSRNDFGFFEDLVMEPYFTLEDYVEIKETANLTDTKRPVADISLPLEFPFFPTSNNIFDSPGRKAKNLSKLKEFNVTNSISVSSKRLEFLKSRDISENFLEFSIQLDNIYMILKNSGLLTRCIFKQDAPNEGSDVFEELELSSIELGVFDRCLKSLIYFSKNDVVRDLNALFSNICLYHKNDVKILEQIENLKILIAELLDQVNFDQVFEEDKEKLTESLFEVFPGVYSQVQENEMKRFLFYKEDPALTQWRSFLASNSKDEENLKFLIPCESRFISTFHSSYSSFASWNGNHVLTKNVPNLFQDDENKLFASYLGRNKLFMERAFNHRSGSINHSSPTNKFSVNKPASSTYQMQVKEENQSFNNDNYNNLSNQLLQSSNNLSADSNNHINPLNVESLQSTKNSLNLTVKVENQDTLPSIIHVDKSSMPSMMMASNADQSADRNSVDAAERMNGVIECANDSFSTAQKRGTGVIFSDENSAWDVPPLVIEETDLKDSLSYQVCVEFLKQSIAIKLAQHGFDDIEVSCSCVFSEALGSFIENIGFSLSNYSPHYEPIDSMNLALMYILPNGIQSLKSWLISELIFTDNCLRTTSESRVLSWCDNSTIEKYKKALAKDQFPKSNLIRNSKIMKDQNRLDYMFSIANVSNSVGNTNSLHLIIPSFNSSNASHIPSGNDVSLSVSELTVPSYAGTNMKILGANLKTFPTKRTPVISTDNNGSSVGSPPVTNTGMMHQMPSCLAGPMMDSSSMDHTASPANLQPPSNVVLSMNQPPSGHHEVNQLSISTSVPHQTNGSDGYSTGLMPSKSAVKPQTDQISRIYSDNQFYLKTPPILPSSSRSSSFNSPANILATNDKQQPIAPASSIYYPKIQVNTPPPSLSKIDKIKIPLPSELGQHPISIATGREPNSLAVRRKAEKRKRASISDNIVPPASAVIDDDKSVLGRRIRTRRLSSQTNYSEDYYYSNEDQLLDHSIDREPVKKRRKSFNKKQQF